MAKMNNLFRIRKVTAGTIKLLDLMPRIETCASTRLKCDEAIVCAARISTNQALKGFERDKKLIHYLYSHDHMTPFEMIHFKFEVELPKFIAAQWMRHRDGSFNELSGRYTKIPNKYYIPPFARLQDQKNKQMSASIDQQSCEQLTAKLHDYIESTKKKYDDLLDHNVAREVARMFLPINYYTKIIWSVNLRSLHNFIYLRLPKTAQFEIQEFASELLDIINECCPISTEIFKKLKLSKVQ